VSQGSGWKLLEGGGAGGRAGVGERDGAAVREAEGLREIDVKAVRIDVEPAGPHRGGSNALQKRGGGGGVDLAAVEEGARGARSSEDAGSPEFAAGDREVADGRGAWQGGTGVDGDSNGSRGHDASREVEGAV